MRHKWLPAVCAAVVVLAAACSSGGMSASKGKEHADQTREATAAVYWKVHGSLSAPVSDFDGAGHFAKCGRKGSTSVQYIVRSLVGAAADKKLTSESLMQTMADQLADAGWHLSPADGDHRSAEKGGTTVELEPPGFGAEPTTVLQVESGCVDVGSASGTVTAGYYTNANWDQYQRADASKSPVPTAFPSAG